MTALYILDICKGGGGHISQHFNNAYIITSRTKFLAIRGIDGNLYKCKGTRISLWNGYRLGERRCYRF